MSMDKSEVEIAREIVGLLDGISIDAAQQVLARAQSILLRAQTVRAHDPLLLALRENDAALGR
jgi:hypothetical protein